MRQNLIEKTVIIVIVIAVLFVVVFAYSNSTSKKPKEIKEFTIQAFRFGYSPDTISVNKGDKVRLNINNTDVPHGIRIPELNIKDENRLEFTADKAGQFDWYCLVPCGSGHMQMKGKLIVK